MCGQWQTCYHWLMISDRVAGNETGSGWLYGSMLSMDRSSSIQMSVTQKHHTNKAENATVYSISAPACLVSFHFLSP